MQRDDFFPPILQFKVDYNGTFIIARIIVQGIIA